MTETPATRQDERGTLGVRRSEEHEARKWVARGIARHRPKHPSMDDARPAGDSCLQLQGQATGSEGRARELLLTSTGGLEEENEGRRLTPACTVRCGSACRTGGRRRRLTPRLAGGRHASLRIHGSGSRWTKSRRRRHAAAGDRDSRTDDGGRSTDDGRRREREACGSTADVESCCSCCCGCCCGSLSC